MLLNRPHIGCCLLKTFIQYTSSSTCVLKQDLSLSIENIQVCWQNHIAWKSLSLICCIINQKLPYYPKETIEKENSIPCPSINIRNTLEKKFISDACLILQNLWENWQKSAKYRVGCTRLVTKLVLKYFLSPLLEDYIDD